MVRTILVSASVLGVSILTVFAGCSSSSTQASSKDSGASDGTAPHKDASSSGSGGDTGSGDDGGGDSGGTCAECTYTVYLTAGGVSTSNSYFLAIWYLTDSSCPPAVGQEFVNLDIGANGTMLNDNPGYTNMQLCTRASNPIVQDCGQSQLWYVNNFTLTVTQSSISGGYQSQYWTWDTASNGAITNCSIEYNFTQPFTLTPVFSTTSLSSNATTSQQSSATPSPPLVQTSGSSTTSSSSTTTSTTTSKHSGGSGYLIVEILAAASVLVVLAAGSWVFLRRRP